MERTEKRLVICSSCIQKWIGCTKDSQFYVISKTLWPVLCVKVKINKIGSSPFYKENNLS